MTIMKKETENYSCSSFCKSLLRATRQELPWQTESSYVVPTAEKDALPHASEGPRQVQTCFMEIHGVISYP